MTEAGLVSVHSRRSVKATIDRLEAALKAAGVGQICRRGGRRLIGR